MKSKEKYKVMIVAYKDIDEATEKKIQKYALRKIKTIEQLENDRNFHSNSPKAFSMNDRISIYISWINEDAKEKIQKGYTIAILELPIEKSEGKVVGTLKALDIVFEDNILILAEKNI
ncbi:MAG: hypothetical protein AB2421_05795 [Thermotaleaceae bacterium]